MGLGFNIVALLYVIFVIKDLKSANKGAQEVKAGPASATVTGQEGIDNTAYEITNLDNVEKAKAIQNESNPNEPLKSVFWLKDFFDPTLVSDYIRFPFIKRPNNGRMILLLLILAYVCIVGPVYGELDFWNRFTFLQLNWNGNDYSIYSTFNSALALVGELLPF